MRIYADTVQYKSKPIIEDVKQISRRIYNHREKVTNEELLNKFLKGYSVVFGVFVNNSTQNELYSQDYVAIDIDNSDPDKPQYTLEEAKNDLFISNNALFMYTTFNHTEETHRFRIIFKLSTTQKSKDSISFIYKKLIDKLFYVNFDKSCKNASRIFYGTNPDDNYHYVFNMMNELDIEELISDIKLTQQNETLDYNMPTWELMKARTIEADKEIKRRWKVYNKKVTVADNNQAKEYIKTLDMAKLLGISNPKSFNDILSEDDNPSASIYLYENKVYLYHRFNHNDNRDIIKLVSELRGIGMSNGLNYLCNLLNIQFDDDNHYLKNIKDSVDQFRYDLLTLDLSKVNPNAHKFLKDERSQRGFIIANILDILQYSVILINNRPEMISDLSVRELSIRIFGTDKGRNRINQCLKVLNIIGIIETLDYEGIPKDMLKNLLAYQKNNHYSKRTNVHKITGEYHNLGSNDSINLFNDIKEKGINSNSLTKEGIALTLGKDKSDRMFVQGKDRDLSNTTKDIQDTGIKYIKEQLGINKYIEENKVIDYVVSNTDYSKYKVSSVLKKSRYYYTQGYGIYFDRLNKELKNRLGITKYSSQERPTVYYS